MGEWSRCHVGVQGAGGSSVSGCPGAGPAAFAPPPRIPAALEAQGAGQLARAALLKAVPLVGVKAGEEGIDKLGGRLRPRGPAAKA